MGSPSAPRLPEMEKKKEFIYLEPELLGVPQAQRREATCPTKLTEQTQDKNQDLLTLCRAFHFPMLRLLALVPPHKARMMSRL